MLRDVQAKLLKQGRSFQMLELDLIVRLFIGEIVDGAFKRKVRVPGLGHFEVKARRGRKVRNPHTNEMMRIPAQWSLKFRATKHLRRLPNGNKPKL